LLHVNRKKLLNVKIITGAYIAKGKSHLAPLSEKLFTYGLDSVAKLYNAAMGGSSSIAASSTSFGGGGIGVDPQSLLKVMGNQMGLMPAMNRLFKPQYANGERKATSMRPLISDAMLN